MRISEANKLLYEGEFQADVLDLNSAIKLFKRKLEETSDPHEAAQCLSLLYLMWELEQWRFEDEHKEEGGICGL